MAIPAEHVVTEKEALLLEQAALENPPAPLPTPDEVKAANAYFQSNPEANAAGLLAAWGSVMLLHDLAGEHLSRTAEIEEESKEKETD
jgi:hypothetical protein